MDMNRNTCGRDRAGEEGVALVYMAVTLTTLLLATGLAVDAGRAYVVKAQLTKAVDGAALGAARHLNSGNPRGEAEQIFKANFPAGYLGTSSVTDPTTAGDFFSLVTDNVTAVSRITIKASTVLPTTFMKLGNFDQVTVGASGEATRRMVDLSLVMDVSSSIGWRWPYVRDAARTFVDAFDPLHDRLSLITYSTGSTVLDQMPASRGFDRAKVKAALQRTPGGSTADGEGLYEWENEDGAAVAVESPIIVRLQMAPRTASGNSRWTGIAKPERLIFQKCSSDGRLGRPDINGFDTRQDRVARVCIFAAYELGSTEFMPRCRMAWRAAHHHEVRHSDELPMQTAG